MESLPNLGAVIRSTGRVIPQQRPTRREHEVERVRLSDQIRRTPDRGVVVLTAPLGYGASTALVHALEGERLVAWVGMGDLSLGLDDLGAEVQEAFAALGVNAVLASSARSSTRSLARTIAEELRTGSIGWLVLDGLDVRRHAPALPVIQYLMDHLPPGSRLALTSHDALEELPLPALASPLAVLGRRELSLTADEAAAILVNACPGLGADVVEALITAADGWVAACAGALAHARRHEGDDVYEWLMGPGVDRLVHSLVSHVSPGARDFLLQTAFLDELCAPLCDTVRESADALTWLTELTQYGALLIKSEQVSDDLAWWTRHPLLTVGLRRMAFGRDFSAGHVRAAEWFRDRRAVEQVMSHLIAAGRFSEAANFLEAHENDYYVSGEVSRAAAWYVSIPVEAWDEKGWHLVRLAWSRSLTVDVRGAEVAVEQLRSHLGTRSTIESQELSTLLGELALLESHLATMLGDSDRIVQTASRSLDLMTDRTPINSRQLAPLLMTQGLLWQGDLDATRRHLAGIENDVFATDLLREAILAGLRARLLVEEGRIELARHVTRKGLAWLQSQSLDAFEVGAGGLEIAMAAVDLEGGDARAAIAGFERAAQEMTRRAFIGSAMDALQWQSRARMVAGDLAAAMGSLQQARSLMHEFCPHSSFVRRLNLQEAWVRHLAGDNVRAERLVQALPRTEQTMPMWARLTMQRQRAGALRTLAGVASTTPRSSAELQVLLGSAAMRRSTRLAETHLLKAADIAAEHGLALVFFGSPTELLDVAEQFAIREGHDHLLDLALGARRRIRIDAGDSAPASVVMGDAALSPGELQLLKFLPGRDGNAAIAARLGVSVNTVKTRLQRLYRKLGVSTRDSAILVARQRGLLP